MSYILDALKKADAQRERDPARGIHAQLGRTSPAYGAPRTRAPWIWAACAAGVAAMAFAGWVMFRGGTAPVPVLAAAESPAPTSVAPALVQPAVAQPVVAQAVMPPPVVVPPPANAAPAKASPAAPPLTAPVPNRAERRVGGPAVPVAGPSAAPSAAAPAEPPGMAPPAARAAASAPVPTAAGSAAPAPASAPVTAPAVGLPPDAPKLTITGGVYSASKAQRMLIVNGRVVAEGADLGSGVILEEIKPKSAILRFRGARYSVGY